MDRARTQLLAALCVVGMAACLHPAEERVSRDFEEVGRTRIGEVEIAIEPGAVIEVREDAVTRVVLRASAPVVEVQVSGGDGSAFLEIRIENLTADAVVVGEGVAAVDAPSPLARLVSAASPARFRAQPADVADARPVRFAYASDFHVRTDNVAAMVAAVLDDPTIEMVLSGGDLVDKGPSRTEWDAMTGALAGLPVPFYSTVGNHEVNFDDGAEYHRRLGRMTYAFDYHGTRVVFADSANATLDPRVFDFTDRVLSAEGAGARLLVTHVPPLDSSGLRNGGFSSRLEAERFLAMLVRNQVDLTFYGHIHALEVFENAGIPAYVGGGGGGHDNVFDDVEHYFLVVTVDPQTRDFAVEIVDL